MILEVVVSPVNDENGDLIGISTIARDLTARRLAEKATHDKDILHRLIIAQEDERSRISRDLHDELGQEMTALQFALARAKTACNDDIVCAHIDTASDIARTIDKSVDFLAWELRPAPLDHATRKRDPQLCRSMVPAFGDRDGYTYSKTIGRTVRPQHRDKSLSHRSGGSQ